MRAEFAAELVAVAREDERVVLLTGDLGFAVLEPFAEEFPERFFNVGVAEQNMLGVATGLADAGFLPFAYSIATFASMRGYEFLRNGAALHELPVRLVGMGAGFDYGHNGVTHYALEDVAIMRAQPGVCTIAPADADQARKALHATFELPGPSYIRLCKEGTPVPGLDGRFELGRADVLAAGEDVALVALGNMASTALGAAEELARSGISAAVAVVSSFNPSPVELEQGGWGRAVRAGLAAADGDLLCYTNSARTSPQMLSLALLYASSNPDVAVKAQRRIRDNWRRQLGSLVYNLECRVLFGLASWDINGTPKAFPRAFGKLLELSRDDDLIDAEFVLTCKREGYPIVEVPSTITVRHGGSSTTNVGSAMRMYRGAYALRRQIGDP